MNNGNTATAPLTVTLVGAGAAQLSVTTTCGDSIPPLSPCQFIVQYLPVDAAEVTAFMTVTDGTSTVLVTIVGSAIWPVDAAVDASDGPDATTFDTPAGQ